jgi:hypothetical protein
MNKNLYSNAMVGTIFSMVLIFIVFSGNVKAQNWTIYDASVVPLENVVPGFTRSNVSGVSNDIFDSWSTIVVDPDNGDNSFLQFLDNAAGQRGMWRSNLPSETSKLTFVAKIKAYDYGNLDWTLDLDFDFGTVREQFFIMNNDKVRVRRGTDTTHDLPAGFDLTNWNTFRFVFDNDADPKTVKVYLNEAATPFIEATPAAGSSNNYFRFGNGDNNRTAGYLMDWIIWDTSGAYAPGEGAAIPDPVVTPAWDATLSELKADDIAITGFDPATLTYEVVLAAGTTDVPAVTATPADVKAAVQITQAIGIPGNATILVTAENGITTRTYTISFRTISDVATLQQIAVNGTPIADFDPAVLTYEVALPLETTTENPVVTATATGPNATVEITQATALPGSATIVVTAEDGIATQTYTINFSLVSTDATLTDLLADGTTIPGFDPEVTEYQLFYPVGTTNIPVISAVTKNENATVEFTQATEFPGIATVDVTAEDGITKLTYTVNLLAGSSIATLSDLLIDGTTIDGFDADVTEYFVVLAAGTTNIPQFTAVATDEKATVVLAQAQQLPGTATVTVTAEDNFTKLVYTVNIRTQSQNADLSDLLVNGFTVANFAADVVNYNVELPSGTTQVPVVAAETEDENASVGIVDATELPGITTIIVTAEDGVTEKTYTLNFNIKEGPSNWKVYDALVLPDVQIPRFNTSNVGGAGATNAIVADPDDQENSFLEMITPANSDTQMWATALEPETPGVTFVFKVKAANNEARRVLELDIHHNGIRERLYINREMNRVRLNESIIVGLPTDPPPTGDNKEIAAPEGVLLSDWNIYRLTKSGGDIKLYLNENPVPLVEGTSSVTSNNQYFRFGSGNSSHSIAAVLDWIIWDETGAFAPGEGSAIPAKVVTPNWDATLSELKIDGDLIEGFDAEVLDYDIVLADGTTTIPQITALKNNPDAEMVITQATELPGNATVEVTAINGFTVNTYNVVFRFASANAELAKINIGTDSLEDFAADKFTYDVVLAHGTTEAPVVDAETADPNATVEITQATALPGSATIVVTAEDGTTQATYTVNFTVSTSVINNETVQFRIFPNPAKDQLHIQMAADNSGRMLRIISTNGQVVLQQNLESTSEIIDISFLKQGVYIVSIISEREQVRQLFIKQ